VNLRVELPPEAYDQLVADVAARVLAELHAQQPAPALMSVAEAAAYLRCDRQRVYDLVSARRLPKLKDGARVLLRRADLDAHLAGKR
jgi:excisionase family DNA binding protein